MAKQKQSTQKKTLNAADEVERSVRSIQAAFDKGKRETLRGLMTEDHVSIMTYTHSSNAAELLKSISDYNFSEYKISEQRVNPLLRTSPSRRTTPHQRNLQRKGSPVARAGDHGLGQAGRDVAGDLLPGDAGVQAVRCATCEGATRGSVNWGGQGEALPTNQNDAA